VTKSEYFSDKNGLFILYNFTQNEPVAEYNPSRYATRISPDSTFKIALSLMAFDQNLITQSTIFKWDGMGKGLPAWNQNQTSKTWLKYSAVWVSQAITPKLGMPRIEIFT